MAGEPMTFSDLMPTDETQGRRKSLREFLRDERIREGRTEEEINSFNKMIKRGGSLGQFTT